MRIHLRQLWGPLAACAVVVALMLLRLDFVTQRGAASEETAGPVQVYVFNRQGELIGPVESPRVVLSDSEWRQRLPSEQYKVLRSKGTERAFCGVFLDNKLKGVYSCAGCALPLFASAAKFNSGTGWPSFLKPLAPGNVEEEKNQGLGYLHAEILCARCGGHLGHVFDDGPAPTGMRYCLNSAALNFTPNDRLAELADPAAELPEQHP